MSKCQHILTHRDILGNTWCTGCNKIIVIPRRITKEEAAAQEKRFELMDLILVETKKLTQFVNDISKNTSAKKQSTKVFELIEKLETV